MAEKQQKINTKIKKGPRYFTFRVRMEQHMFQKHNGTFWLYMVLRVLVIVAAVLAALRRDFQNVLLCALVLFLFLMPSCLERKLKIEFPSALEKIILLFTFAAEILGEIGEYYVIFPWWDAMLHTFNGFFCAAIGFAMVDILNENEHIKFQLSPFFMAAMAFCFSMTIGVLWEFFEFAVDNLFFLDMQKDTVVGTISTILLDPTGGNTPVMLSGITEVVVDGQPLGLGGYLDIGLYDTMEDLWVNFLGATAFSIIGYFYMRSRGQGRFARHFIPVRADWGAAEAVPPQNAAPAEGGEQA